VPWRRCSSSLQSSPSITSSTYTYVSARTSSGWGGGLLRAVSRIGCHAPRESTIVQRLSLPAVSQVIHIGATAEKRLFAVDLREDAGGCLPNSSHLEDGVRELASWDGFRRWMRSNSSRPGAVITWTQPSQEDLVMLVDLSMVERAIGPCVRCSTPNDLSEPKFRSSRSSSSPEPWMSSP
jgi:hypothetical protein